MCSETKVFSKRKDFSAGERTVNRKRIKIAPDIASSSSSSAAGPDLFDSLPDDLVISILTKLSSSATCPSDFINVLITYVLVNSFHLFCFFLFSFFFSFFFCGSPSTNFAGIPQQSGGISRHCLEFLTTAQDFR